MYIARNAPTGRIANLAMKVMSANGDLQAMVLELSRAIREVEPAQGSGN